ncbi:hypothetical protein [Spirosoma areae]
MINRLPIRRGRIARLLLGLFLVMQCSAVVFQHAHRLSNGVLIIHCHPYNPFCKGPCQPNDHTSNELYWLAAVASLLYDDAPLFDFAFGVSLPQVTTAFHQPRQHSVPLPFYSFLQRGPPALPSLLI